MTSTKLIPQVPGSDIYSWRLQGVYRSQYRIYDPSNALAEDPLVFEKMRQDPIIELCCCQRAAMVAGRDWTVVPATDNEKDVRLAKIQTAWLQNVRKFDQARERLAWAFFYSSAYEEMRGTNQRTVLGDEEPLARWWCLEQFENIDKRRFQRFREGDDNHVWRIWDLREGRYCDIPESDIPFYVRHAVEDREQYLKYARGLVDALYFAHYAKGIALSRGLEGLDTFARGWITAKIGQERAASTDRTNEDIRDTWIDELEKMRARHVLAYGSDDEVALVETTGAGHKIVTDFLEYLDGQMTRLILGSLRPTGGGAAFATGARAQAETESNMTEARIQMDQAALDDTISGEVLGLFMKMNMPTLRDLGLGDARSGKFRSIRQKEDSPETVNARIDTAARNKIPLVKSQVYEVLNMDQPGEEDEVFDWKDAGGDQEGPPGQGGGAFPFVALADSRFRADDERDDPPRATEPIPQPEPERQPEPDPAPPARTKKRGVAKRINAIFRSLTGLEQKVSRRNPEPQRVTKTVERDPKTGRILRVIEKPELPLKIRSVIRDHEGRVVGAEEFAATWDESKHPRDDQGRFVSKDELDEAAQDPAKAQELLSRVTNPSEREKLLDIIGTASPSTSQHATASDPRIPPKGSMIRRKWRGDDYVVEVTEGGFKLVEGPGAGVGEEFPSLTALAKSVTGAKTINGVVWWGLGKRKPPGAVPPTQPKPPKRKPKAEAPKGGGSRSRVDEKTWARPPRKLPPPDPEQVAALGFYEKTNGGWENAEHDLTIEGPRAREVLQVFLDNPKAMTDDNHAQKALRQMNVHFTSMKEEGIPQKRASHARFGAVAAMAALRSQGLTAYVQCTHKPAYRENVNGWFCRANPQTVNMSSGMTSTRVSKLATAEMRPERPWTWGGNSRAATWIHEVGHMMHNRNCALGRYAAMDDWGSDEYARGRFPWARNEEMRNKLRQGWKDKQISKYGSTNPHEFVAEVWTRKCHGYYVSNEVMDVYRQLDGPILPGWSDA